MSSAFQLTWHLEELYNLTFTPRMFLSPPSSQGFQDLLRMGSRAKGWHTEWQNSCVCLSTLVFIRLTFAGSGSSRLLEAGDKSQTQMAFPIAVLYSTWFRRGWGKLFFKSLLCFYQFLEMHLSLHTLQWFFIILIFLFSTDADPTYWSLRLDRDVISAETFLILRVCWENNARLPCAV